MKLIKNAVVLAFALLISAVMTAQEYDINFVQGSWKEVLKMAKKQNKPIFVDCYTSWCGPCKTLAKEVFTQKKVADFFNQNFVCVSMDMEKGEAIKLKSDWKLKAFPTLLFFDPTGKENHRIVGAFDADEFLGYSKMALDEKKMASNLQKRYDAGERNGEFMFDYLVSLRLSYNEDLEKKVANDYLKSLKEEDLLKKENWNVIENFMSDPLSPEFQYLVTNKAKLALVVGADQAEAKIYKTISKQIETWTFWYEKTAFETEKESNLIKFLQESAYEKSPELLGKLLVNKCKRLKDTEQYLEVLDHIVKFNLAGGSGTIVRYAEEIVGSYTSEVAWAKALTWLKVAEGKETKIEHKAAIFSAKSKVLAKLGNKSESEIAKLAAEKADKESEAAGTKIHTVPMMKMTGMKPNK